MSALHLRVRSAGHENDGPSQAMVESGMRAFGGEQSIETIAVIVAPGSGPERSAGSLIDAAVSRALVEGLFIMIDLWGEDSPGVRPSIGDELVGEAMIELSAVAADGFVACVLLREVPTVADAMHDVLVNENLRANVAILTPDGQFAGSTSLPQDADAFLTALLVKTDPAPVGDYVLRRRGVFRSLGAEPSPSYYMFQYDFLPDGEGAVVVAFKKFFQKLGAHLIIFDASNSSDWFSSWVLRAAVELQLPCVDVHNLAATTLGTVAGSEPLLSERIAELLNADASVVALVSASVDSGATLARMLDILKPIQRGNAGLLSVFGNESRPSTIHNKDRAGGQSIFEVGKLKYTAEFLVGVTFRPLSSKDWKVGAAIRLGEVVETRPGDGSFYRRNSLAITRTAIWSLLEELETLPERNVPDGRGGVLHFPDLTGLGPFDAHWIAEAIVERMVVTGNRVRGSLVFLVPNQDTGAAHLASALNKRCEVEVVQTTIGTAGIVEFSAEDANRIEMLRASYFVAFDESAVTYGTLRSIGSAFESLLQRALEHHAVVVDLGRAEDRPVPLLSLIAWQPFGHNPVEAAE